MFARTELIFQILIKPFGHTSYMYAALIDHHSGLLCLFGAICIVSTCGLLTIYTSLNLHPLTPHFSIAKVGFTGVYIFVLIFALKGRF